VGYVVVSPGCRGRDNQAAGGTYYGKAPAAIADLEAADRYIRHNTGVIPGNVDWIISSGCSAGGAVSALLGASGNSPLYGAIPTQSGGPVDQELSEQLQALFVEYQDHGLFSRFWQRFESVKRKEYSHV
jgi:hypothetical protein